MHPVILAATLGVLLIIFAASLISVVLVALWYQDGLVVQFLAIQAICAFSGVVLWLLSRKRETHMRNRDGFAIATMMWVVVSVLGALPFMVILDMSLADSVFESTSAFTTTGATTILGLDALPMSLLFYRQQLQWLGGIGVIISAIALLPMLGVGGMQLLKAETPGPIKENTLTPRIRSTAHVVWMLYLGITVACAFCYWLAGMSWFDAVGHSFATVSTGGFSTHDASLAYFNNPMIEFVAVIFMMAGAMNFSVHFLVWRKRDLGYYLRNEEARALIILVIVTALIIAGVLHQDGHYGSFAHTIRFGFFEVVSVVTSTGFGISDFSIWPLMLPVLLMFISFVGGCAGSTAGGIKVIRFVVLAKQAGIEVNRLIHPQLVKPLTLDGKTIPNKVVQTVWAYFAIYVTAFAVLMLALMQGGMDQVTAFGAVTTCLNNLGPGLGDVASNFVSVTAGQKWMLSGAMLLGRLEIFTIFVIFTPSFWRV
jgi:trk system potassium uptake protein TrkH